MKKALLYVAVVLVGALGCLAVLRALEVLATGNLSAYGAGKLTGSVLMGVLCFLVASKAFKSARAA